MVISTKAIIIRSFGMTSSKRESLSPLCIRRTGRKVGWRPPMLGKFCHGVGRLETNLSAKPAREARPDHFLGRPGGDRHGREAVIAARRIVSFRLRTSWCPGPDSNRHGRLKPRDFKSLASTDFATRALRLDHSGVQSESSMPKCGQG